MAVRSFFIEMVFRRHEPHQKLWTKVLCTFAKLLKNVQNVNICFEYEASPWLSGPRSRAELEARRMMWPPVLDILVLKKLSLKSATVVISHSVLYRSMNVPNGILAREQEWAGHIKEVILK